MQQIVLLVCLGAAANFTACSTDPKQETTTTTTETTTTAAPADNTAVVMDNDTVATGAALDSVRHAHLHESKGMVHNHEHGHPAADTAHRGQ